VKCDAISSNVKLKVISPSQEKIYSSESNDSLQPTYSVNLLKTIQLTREYNS